MHEHVELATDGGRSISRQAVEIVHHVHLIVIPQSVGNVCPLRGRRGCLAVQCRLEADDPRVQLGCNSDLVTKAPFKTDGSPTQEV